MTKELLVFITNTEERASTLYAMVCAGLNARIINCDFPYIVIEKNND